MCTSCLRTLAGARIVSKGSRFAWLRVPALAFTGLILALTFFYAAGQWMLTASKPKHVETKEARYPFATKAAK